MGSREQVSKSIECTMNKAKRCYRIIVVIRIYSVARAREGESSSQFYKINV